MTQEEEEYVHLVTCISNLNKALWILQTIKQSKGDPLVNPAFQFALVEYSKPYKRSRGDAKSSHQLGGEYVPLHFLNLHKEIVDARDQIHAHSDLTIHEAKVYVSTTNYGKHVGISRNIIFDTEKLTKLDDIISLIEQSLDIMMQKVKQLEEALPLNS